MHWSAWAECVTPCRSGIGSRSRRCKTSLRV
ncbi:MAG: hypothetical protein EOO38_28475 [Cytophagaceae bacterium]|nr:MAG: hypothetical protein EOO38_28475 [Cytophagaceae bacterium]